jgi:predicted nucleic acid-binding protein
MGQYLIDNNVISNYFSGQYSVTAMNFLSEIIDAIPNIFVITEIEALAWISPDKNKEGIVKDFIADANVLPISPAVVTKCVAIRRSRKIKTPDAVIAATALVHGLTLLTHDSDFNKIAGLTVLNPHSL